MQPRLLPRVFSLSDFRPRLPLRFALSPRLVFRLLERL
eukprot:UN20095